MFSSATGEEIKAFWNIISSVDKAVTQNDRAKAILSDRPKLKLFMEHCCVVRHYHFSIKKCGLSECSICKPPRLPDEIFKSLHCLPDPIPDSDGEHYKSFDDVYGTKTTEKTSSISDNWLSKGSSDAF